MKALLVARYELVTLLRKPAFVIVALVMPILGVLVLTVINLAQSGSPSNNGSDPPSEQLQVEGFIDQAGLIRAVPTDLPQGILIEYSDEDQAALALSAGRIAAYYVVPADYVETGELVYVHPTLNPLADDRQDWIMRHTLLFNLLGQDVEIMDRMLNPMLVEETDRSLQGTGTAGDCARPGADCNDSPFVRLLPMFIMVFFFVAFTNGAALLIRSVAGEKENRLIEILASSVDPLQLMTGKILGLGIATLIAFAAWVLAAGAALRLSQPNLPVGFEIPGNFLPWAIVFFLLGFTMYASMMAGVGALVPNIKDTTKASWFVIGPMMVGYMFGIFTMEQPHGPLMTFLSLFPVTSPINMVQRLTTGAVPAWQPPVAAVLLGIAVFLAVKTAARFFRAHNLLSGQPFSANVLFRALRD